MLRSHMNAIEATLLAQSDAARNAGHPNLRGGPREWFVREFIAEHLPSSMEVGQGEIIDINSEPNPPPGRYRPQIDVVLYRRDLPKITYSQNNCAYLAEGVNAVIEVKSNLTKEELKGACKASVAVKSLQRSEGSVRITRGSDWQPGHIITYILAYNSSASITTVGSWFREIKTELDVSPGLMIDMAIILGKGLIWRIDAFPGLQTNNPPQPNHKWTSCSQEQNNIFTFFAHMLLWQTAFSTPPNVMTYARSLSLTNIRYIEEELSGGQSE